MPTYYRGPDALITDEVVVVAGRGTFRIGKLRDVHVVHRDLHRERSWAAHAAGGAIVILAALWPVLRSPVAYVAAFLVLAGSLAVSGACWRLRPRAYELRATYANLEVVLFSSTDPTRFGQVTRAMVRALDARQHRLEDN